jgi:hypothetical protein
MAADPGQGIDQADAALGQAMDSASQGSAPVAGDADAGAGAESIIPDPGQDGPSDEPNDGGLAG